MTGPLARRLQSATVSVLPRAIAGLFLYYFSSHTPVPAEGKVISQEYILEYGRDCLEMHVGAVGHGERALVVDDLIATG
ncbi:hypothetical protein Fmac_015719 [Flemingia macrophylla]|uniref:adenine phosphoribosyltransferase n=1 Tax=Flemingia macrophylla TaxID=520843 RepID=A0ABD1MFF2_9FABA